MWKRVEVAWNDGSYWNFERETCMNSWRVILRWKWNEWVLKCRWELFSRVKTQRGPFRCKVVIVVKVVFTEEMPIVLCLKKESELKIKSNFSYQELLQTKTSCFAHLSNLKIYNIYIQMLPKPTHKTRTSSRAIKNMKKN